VRAKTTSVTALRWDSRVEPSAGVSAARELLRADVAQLVEHSLGKGEVTSSILVIGSMSLRRLDAGGAGQEGLLTADDR
jgi:hypothetical protein